MTKAGNGGESCRACFVQSSANRTWGQAAWTLDQSPTGTGSHACWGETLLLALILSSPWTCCGKG